MQGKPQAIASKKSGQGQQALWGYVRQHKITAFGALLVIALQVALGVLLARQLGAISRTDSQPPKKPTSSSFWQAAK